MGTYLMTGLRIKAKIYCKHEKDAKIIKKGLINNFEIENLYTFSWKDEYLTCTINENILRKELILFLTDFYNLYYANSYSKRYETALDFLKNNPYEEWDKFFEDSICYECRYDTMQEYIYITKNFL